MNRSYVLAGAVVIGLAALGLLQRRPSVWPAPPQPDAPAPSPTEADAPPINDLPESPVVEPAVGPPVVIRTDRPLATVNGVVITLRDLIPLSETNAPTQYTFTTAGYHYLLERAIERELVTQQARAQGITLTPHHHDQLAHVEQAYYGRDGVAPDNVLARPNETSSLENQIHFAVRDAAGRLLLTELLAANGVPPPHVTEAQVLAHYQEHRQQFGALPESPAERDAAWQRIRNQIRQELTRANLRSYQTEQETYLARLRSRASVEVPNP
jgi:hypothetical protein